MTNVGAKPLCARGIGKYGTELSGLSARVRTEGLPDLRVNVTDSVPSMDLVDPADEPTISGDQAARLLLLWGRSPATPATRLRAFGANDDALRLRRLLSGY